MRQLLAIRMIQQAAPVLTCGIRSPNMDNMNNIRLIRQRLNLSQEKFGQAIGVTQGNISHYEAQLQNVPPDVARRVIEAAASMGVVVTFNDIYDCDQAEDAA